MAFIRKYHRGGHTYYARVESYRDEQGRPRQRVLEWLSTNPHPTTQPVTMPIEPVHFGLIATRLMERTLTPDDVFTLLADMGQLTNPSALEAIGIRFEFAEKKLTLSLYPPSKPSRPPPAAQPATRRSQKKKRTNASGSSRSKDPSK